MYTFGFYLSTSSNVKLKLIKFMYYVKIILHMKNVQTNQEAPHTVAPAHRPIRAYLPQDQLKILYTFWLNAVHILKSGLGYCQKWNTFVKIQNLS